MKDAFCVALVISNYLLPKLKQKEIVNELIYHIEKLCFTYSTRLAIAKLNKEVHNIEVTSRKTMTSP